LGTILLEIPQRTVGQLNEWDDLVEISEYAKDNNIRLHLDGARIWESQPYYGKSFQEIGNLFDSIYVSFYKGLNNLTGAMLIGPKKFIEASKIWQRRHGGNLRTQFPYVISAKMAIEKNLPRIPLYVEKAKEIASVLNSYDLIAVTPKIPPTNLFNVIIQVPLEKVKEVNLAIADKHKIWLFSLKQAFVDDWSQSEINVGESALDLDMGEFKLIMDEFVQSLKD
jgi:threonine aldolase